ncbi:type II secretion system protein GspC [Vibrio salilacus]|uniref:type II secretion system protein GspC n=1 Tax=Vibrio salilacus TaxID=1323749 RepID=UPI001FED0F1A|nr:type II secretion system protein GspC [Vibrio salilacus]
MKQRSVNALYQFGEAFKDVGVQQRVSYAVMLLLLAMCAWIAGQMIWQPWSQPVISSWQPAKVTLVGNQSSRLDISQLLNSNIFGQYQNSVPVIKQPKVQDAPKSRLNVVLVGIVTSTEANKNLAVIANRGQQATYGLDEVIEGTRAKLIQVQTDRVIIDNSGRNETIMLEGLKYSRPTAPVAQPITHRQISTDTLEQIQEEIRQDPKQIFQYVRMSQIKQDETVVGYRLTPGKDQALFESVGLISGDIALSINGLDLTNSGVMGEIFQSLSELTELTLTVERDGQPHEIYIEL